MRIRSIKPDFWTSETLALLPERMRLTFIGTWSYVDDNGVGVDNEMLIAAALYPLSGDAPETLRRIAEDLRMLSFAGLLPRYEVDGKRYLFVRNWDEHQKVSHPRKSRYPRPDEAFLTSYDRGTRENKQSLSREPPEDLPSRSAVSREQGAGSRDSAPNGAGAEAPRPIGPGVVVGAWVDAYRESTNRQPSGSMRSQAGKEAKALLADASDPRLVVEAAKAAGAKGFATIEREYGPLVARSRIRPVVDDDGFEPPQAPREVVFADDPEALPRWHAEQRKLWEAGRST